jgi:hypothetical protein
MLNSLSRLVGTVKHLFSVIRKGYYRYFAEFTLNPSFVRINSVNVLNMTKRKRWLSMTTLPAKALHLAVLSTKTLYLPDAKLLSTCN